MVLLDLSFRTRIIFAQATSAYKALITSVDKLDGIASRGMKEKEGLKDDKEILEVYGSCVERESDLITLLPKIL